MIRGPAGRLDDEVVGNRGIYETENRLAVRTGSDLLKIVIARPPKVAGAAVVVGGAHCKTAHHLLDLQTGLLRIWAGVVRLNAACHRKA